MRARRRRNEKCECNSGFCIPRAELAVSSNFLLRLLLHKVASLKLDKVLITCDIYVVDLVISRKLRNLI